MREHPHRRHVLGLAGAGAALIGVALASQARAAATTAKADVKYQYTPKGDANCAACTSFIPAADGGPGPGTCKIVEGPIPQNGWCVLFSAK